jgi:hypothetical protein
MEKKRNRKESYKKILNPLEDLGFSKRQMKSTAWKFEEAMKIEEESY